MHIDTPEQASVREKQGFVCNFTGGYCPSGCREPCVYETDKTLVGGGVERRDYNAGRAALEQGS